MTHKITRLWADRLGIPFDSALLLVEAIELAADIQVGWHNGDKSEREAQEACDKVNTLAAEHGYGTEWPGLYPLLVKDGQRFALPDDDPVGA